MDGRAGRVSRPAPARGLAPAGAIAGTQVAAVGVRVRLVAPEVAELRVERALVACELLGVAFGRPVPAAANILAQPRLIACDLGAKSVDTRVVAPGVAVVLPEIPAIPIRVVTIGSRQGRGPHH